MLHACIHCDQTFGTHLQKANHIRWKHVLPGFSEKGLESIRNSARATNRKRSEKCGELKSEVRTCKCGQIFEVTFREKAKWKGRITCSSKCGYSRERTPESLAKSSESMKKWIRENPEKHAKQMEAFHASPKNLRRSSKIERALAEVFKPEGFTRARVVRNSERNFSVDLTSPCGRIWIESDGPYHFEQIHKSHDFEKSKHRDEVQEREALRRNVLLIRVNNFKFSLEEQVEFIRNQMSSWDNFGSIRKLY